MKKEIIEVDQSRTWIGHAVKTYLEENKGLSGETLIEETNHYTDYFFKGYIALLDSKVRHFEAKEMILAQVREALIEQA